MPVVSNITNAQLAQKISDLVTSWSTYLGQLQTWLAGTAGGGPNSDGTYPLTDNLGTTYSIECPAQLEADVTTIVGNATTQATNAATSATAAAASATSATTQASNASASAATATTKATAASTAASLAGSYAAAAGTYSTNAAASATAAAGSATSAATDETNAAASASAASGSATAAAASAAAAAASATLAATFNPALYAALAGATFTGDVAIGNITFHPGASSPVRGQLIVGDGSGWHFSMAKSVSGTITDLITFSDTGSIAATGTVTGSNLSGTNTGDQNLAPYALLAGATFTGDVVINGSSSTSTLLLNNTHSNSGVTVRIQEPGHDDVGLELQRISSTQYGIGSYNRASSAYNSMLFYGSDFAWNPTAGAMTLSSIGALNINTGTAGTPLTLTTGSSGPWALQIVRSDIGNTISMFNVGGILYIDHPVEATGFETGGTYLRTAAGQGYLDGGYAGVETSSTSGAIYSIGGGSYVPGNTTLGNMYGIGFTYSGSGICNGAIYPTGWGMYVASAGTARIFLSSDSGDIFCAGEILAGSTIEAPYFYNTTVSSYGMSCAQATAVGGLVKFQSGGTASGGNPGDIIFIY